MEQNIIAKTTEGTTKICIKRLANGQYQIDASFYDPQGYYVAHKSSTRIVNTFQELTICGK